MSLYTTQKRTQTHAQRKNKIRPIFSVYRRYFLTICAVGGKKMLKRRFYPPFSGSTFRNKLKASWYDDHNTYLGCLKNFITN